MEGLILSNIALQVSRTTAGTVNSGTEVVFNIIDFSAGNISYNPITGVITFNETGRYFVDWWVASQATVSTNSVIFSLVSSQGDMIKGASPVKTGQLSGLGIIDVGSVPVTLKLVNQSNSHVTLSQIVPVKASLIIEQENLNAGPTGATGPTGPTGTSNIFIETTSLGDINTSIAYNQGGGNNQAIGALVFGGRINRNITRISAYVMQVGSTGNFQMAILLPTSISQAQVVAITNTVTSLTGGLFTLLLTAPLTLLANTVYYLAVYNQVNGSSIGGLTAGTLTTGNASPINFRVQNLAGFTIGQTINTSDVSLRLTPWLAASE